MATTKRYRKRGYKKYYKKKFRKYFKKLGPGKSVVVNPEIKYLTKYSGAAAPFDSAELDTLFSSGIQNHMNGVELVNLIIPGTGPNQRIGHMIRVLYVDFTATVQTGHSAAPGIGTWDDAYNNVRFMGGVFSTMIGGTYAYSTVYVEHYATRADLPNLYKTMWDKTITLNSNGQWTSHNAVATSESLIPGSKRIHCKKYFKNGGFPIRWTPSNSLGVIYPDYQIWLGACSDSSAIPYPYCYTWSLRVAFTDA